MMREGVQTAFDDDDDTNHDTLERLREYIRKQEIAIGWLFPILQFKRDSWDLQLNRTRQQSVKLIKQTIQELSRIIVSQY